MELVKRFVNSGGEAVFDELFNRYQKNRIFAEEMRFAVNNYDQQKIRNLISKIYVYHPELKEAKEEKQQETKDEKDEKDKKDEKDESKIPMEVLETKSEVKDQKIKETKEKEVKERKFNSKELEAKEIIKTGYQLTDDNIVKIFEILGIPFVDQIDIPEKKSISENENSKMRAKFLAFAAGSKKKEDKKDDAQEKLKNQMEIETKNDNKDNPELKETKEREEKKNKEDREPWENIVGEQRSCIDNLPKLFQEAEKEAQQDFKFLNSNQEQYSSILKAILSTAQIEIIISENQIDIKCNNNQSRAQVNLVLNEIRYMLDIKTVGNVIQITPNYQFNLERFNRFIVKKLNREAESLHKEFSALAEISVLHKDSQKAYEEYQKSFQEIQDINKLKFFEFTVEIGKFISKTRESLQKTKEGWEKFSSEEKKKELEQRASEKKEHKVTKESKSKTPEVKLSKEEQGVFEDVCSQIKEKWDFEILYPTIIQINRRLLAAKHNGTSLLVTALNSDNYKIAKEIFAKLKDSQKVELLRDKENGTTTIS